jgi:hypothetical protein
MKKIKKGITRKIKIKANSRASREGKGWPVVSKRIKEKKTHTAKY